MINSGIFTLNLPEISDFCDLKLDLLMVTVLILISSKSSIGDINKSSKSGLDKTGLNSSRIISSLTSIFNISVRSILWLPPLIIYVPCWISFLFSSISNTLKEFRLIDKDSSSLLCALISLVLLKYIRVSLGVFILPLQELYISITSFYLKWFSRSR